MRGILPSNGAGKALVADSELELACSVSLELHWTTRDLDRGWVLAGAATSRVGVI